MTTKRQRRIRGTGKATVALNVHIDPSAKAKLNKVADALGLSQGQALDLIVDHADLETIIVREPAEAVSEPRVVTNTTDFGTRGGRQRRTRGAGKLTVALNVQVESVAKHKIDVAADALGKSQGQVLDLMLGRTNVDAHGRPAFWDGPLATDYQRELPLASSA